MRLSKQKLHGNDFELCFELRWQSRDRDRRQKIAEKVQNNELAADEIDEETIRKSLMTASVYPYDDPDLLIRTSGEERISNFLLWQLAYSEMVFTDTFGLIILQLIWRKISANFNNEIVVSAV